MRRVSWIVLGVFLAACSGAKETELFAGSASSSGSSNGSSGAPGKPDSGNTSSSSSSSSGASGDTSSSGTSGNTSSSGASSGTSGNTDDGGTEGCNPAAKESCKSDEYCSVKDCGTKGVCVKKPSDEPRQLAPVCGCDHVTYWNADIAARHGISVAQSGACEGAQAATCGALKMCPVPASCNFDRGTRDNCQLANPTGVCWVIPSQCDGASNERVRNCNNSGTRCPSFCQAIRDEVQFYSQNTNCD